MKVHLQKVYIWDGKPKMQHYFFSHSTGKFLGENEASCASSSNVFLVHENALCKWTKFTCPKKVSLSLFFDLCFVLSLWAVFLDGMTTVLHIMKCIIFQLQVFVQFWWLEFVLSKKENVNFNFFSLNVRGIRSLETRKPF